MDTNPTETIPVSETTRETSASPARDGETSALGALSSRVSDWRRSKAVSAETVAEQRRLRDERRRDEETAQREAANATARKGRKAAADRQDAASDDEVQAPIPVRMQVAGIWADRLVGSLVRLSPLLVSGSITMMVGMEQPLDMDWPIALAFTLSLEGSLWHLGRLKEKFRLEGDGTFSLAMAIRSIIALIFALICGHAIWKANGSQPIDISVPGMQTKVPLSDLVPAIAVAVMSAIGIFVWSKTADFKHRVKLRAQGRLDAAAPKFAVASWFFCPWETFWSLRHAIKYKLVSPLVAVEDWRLWKMVGKPAVWPEPSYETVETLGIETVETSRRGRPVRAVATTVSPETSRASLASPPRLPLSSPETARRDELRDGETSSETFAVSETGDETSRAESPPEAPVSAPPASRLDEVETVGRLHMELQSYSQVADRLGMSKAKAGRLGAEFYKKNGAALTAATAE